MILSPRINIKIASIISLRVLLIASLLGAQTSNTSAADTTAERVFRYKNTQGGVVFSDQIPRNQKYEVLLFDCYACQPDADINWYHIPLFTHQYQQEITDAAARDQLDPALIRAVIHAESGFNPQARSKTGAAGLMQLMPATANSLGVLNRYNPQQNIAAGSHYLAHLLKRFHGDIRLSCAAYNAGPTLVAQLGKIPNYPETQSYVKRVQILLQRYQQANITI